MSAGLPVRHPWPAAVDALARAFADERRVLQQRIEDLQVRLAHAEKDRDDLMKLMCTPYEDLEVVKEQKR